MNPLAVDYPDLESEWSASQKRQANGSDFEKELPLMRAIVGEKFRRIHETENRRLMTERICCGLGAVTEEKEILTMAVLDL